MRNSRLRRPQCDIYLVRRSAYPPEGFIIRWIFLYDKRDPVHYKTGPLRESISESNLTDSVFSESLSYSNVPKCLIVLTIWLV